MLDIHVIFSSNVGLNCLYLLENFSFVIRVVAVKLIIVSLNSLLQCFQHLLAYHSLFTPRISNFRLLFAIRSLRLSVRYIFDKLVQLLYFINLIVLSLHLKFEETLIGRMLDAAVCDEDLVFCMFTNN